MKPKTLKWYFCLSSKDILKENITPYPALKFYHKQVIVISSS